MLTYHNSLEIGEEVWPFLGFHIGISQIYCPSAMPIGLTLLPVVSQNSVLWQVNALSMDAFHKVAPSKWRQTNFVAAAIMNVRLTVQCIVHMLQLDFYGCNKFNSLEYLHFAIHRCYEGSVQATFV